VSIRVLYFAALAEQVGCRSEELYREAATAGELVDALRSRGEPWSSAFGNRIRIAINQQLAEEGDAIRDGDEVAFFPPVTGG
jgi:molybdopterin synthase sulfur carrier subunit